MILHEVLDDPPKTFKSIYFPKAIQILYLGTDNQTLCLFCFC